MPSKTAKSEMLENLRVMLRDVFRLRSEGVPYARLARAHGYVDGYMRALLETSITDKQELLGLVAEERQSAHGPSTAPVEVHEPEAGAAATAAA